MKLMSLCLILGSAFLFPATQALAQDNGLKTVDVKGTIEEFSGFQIKEFSGVQIKIKDKAGKELGVSVDPTSSTVRYTGTADAKVMRPGMMVRFAGSFDSKGTAQSDVKELEIFRPKVGRMMPDEMMSQTPGIYPVDGKQQNISTDKNAADKNAGNSPKNTAANSSKVSKTPKGSSKRPTNKSNDAKTGTAKPVGEVQEFKIVGQVTNVQDNKLQINTGSQAIVVQLAANAKIKVSMPDAELAVKGDAVHVVGLSNAAQPDVVQAKIVTITAAKPLAPQQIDSARKPNDKNADLKKVGKSDSKGSGKTVGKKP
jgi:hypothetical protein